MTGLPGLDVLLLCAGVAATTMLLSMAVNRFFSGWDEKLLIWFSAVASSPKWSFSWVLIFIAWLPLRELFVKYSGWYARDGDLIVLTMLWSVGPFMVENAMKYSNQRQMAALERQTDMILRQSGRIVDLTEAVRDQLDNSEGRDELLHVMVSRLLDAIEEPTSEHQLSLMGLASAVRTQLAKEADTPFRATVAKLVDAILKRPEAA